MDVHTHILKLLPLPWKERVVEAEVGPFTIERVTDPFDYKLEGWLLGHCLGTKNKQFMDRHTVLSLRDRVGVPHATILLARSRTLSEYGRADDLFGSSPGILNKKAVHLLQIRGRHDRIARPEYHQPVRTWWKVIGGSYERDNEFLDMICSRAWPDTDRSYHYSYQFVPNRSAFFDPDFHKEVTGG